MYFCPAVWLIESWDCTRVESGDPSPSLPADTLASLHTAVILVYAPPWQSRDLPQTNPASRGSFCGDNRSRKADNVKAVSTTETKATDWLGFLLS